MISGFVRDNFAYVILPLPSREGVVNVEFLIDTGFEGHLALPSSVLRRLEVRGLKTELVRTVDGRYIRVRNHEVNVDWSGEILPVYALELEGGRPLLGVELLAEYFVTLEVTDGGEVAIEPL